MKFTLINENQAYDLKDLDKISKLTLDGSDNDVNLAKSTLGDNVEYGVLRSIMNDDFNETLTQVHENMILTEKGVYLISVGYTDTPSIYPDKEMLFYKDGKIIKDRVSNMGLIQPSWVYTPFSPQFDYAEYEYKIIDKLFKKVDIKNFDLNNTFLFSAVVFGTNAVISTQYNETTCVSLKGTHTPQRMADLKLWGKYKDSPIFVYNRNGYSFLLRLDNKLTLIKIFN